MYNISIFKNENLHNILCIVLISLLPLSLIIGSLIINIFCILIIIIFLFESFKIQDFTFLKSKEFLLIFIFWIFLLINTLMSTNFEASYQRGFGFIRFIFLVFALRYYFYLNQKKYTKIIFTTWTAIFLVITFDLIFESYFGFNSLGFTTTYPGRLAGFSGDELKIGGYYYGFIAITLTYILLNYGRYFYILFFLLLTVALLIGERANFLKIALMLIPFAIIVKYNNKIKISYLLSILVVAISLIFIFKPVYKGKFYTEFFSNNNNLSLNSILSKSEKHKAHFISSYKIFRDNPAFGVGLKNFRNESGKEKYMNNNEKIKTWSTHPHQIHLEFLSETGLVGYIVFCLFFFISIFNGIKNYFYYKNLYILAGTLFIFTTFLPLIPSGSFFTTYGATIFWINYSLINLKKN